VASGVPKQELGSQKENTGVWTPTIFVRVNNAAIISKKQVSFC
jgi:hypothetical protein